MSLRQVIARNLTRSPALTRAVTGVAALGARPEQTGGWIRLLLYHKIAADQVQDFERQIKYLRKIAKIISLDEALGLRAGDPACDERFVVLTFDDGTSDFLTNAYPVLATLAVPSICFLLPGHIDDSQSKGDGEYLSWDDCRGLSANGVTFGSHSVSHQRFSNLTGDEVRAELENSKARIERELGRPCLHFACPWGQPNQDFLPDRDVPLAKEAGYRSFATTVRGKIPIGGAGFTLSREGLQPEYGISHIRFFFSRG